MMKNLLLLSNTTSINKIFALLIGLLFTTTLLNAQAGNSFDHVDGVDLQIPLCEYWDGDNTTPHYLENYIGLCDTIIVTEESEGLKLGYTTFFEPTGGTGLTDMDAVGIANNTGVNGELSYPPFHGFNAFVMSDIDGILKMRFDTVDLTGTSNPIFSMRGFINATSWELQDSIRITVHITGCTAATTIDLLNTADTDIDGNFPEESWELYTLDLTPYINCDAEVEIMFSSNTTSETFAVDSVYFSEGNVESPLPVELMHFKAADMGEQVVLDWRTASELNNEGFQVERSQDGKHWETIGFVTGRGTTELMNNYSFTDDAPTKGNNYYRLKQMDFDGAYEYSDIQTVFMETEFASIRLFPNPVSNNKVNIAFDELPQQTTTLRLFNMNGQVLQTILVEDVYTAMDLSVYASGMYLLEINNGSELRQERIIKQ